MRCSPDLPKRVIEFVRGGGSKAEAARRFQVSRASLDNWMNAPDALWYQKPGPKQGRKLNWEDLRRQLEQHADLTQRERARQFSVSRHCSWNALRKLGLTGKKNDRVQRAPPAAPKTVSAAS